MKKILSLLYITLLSFTFPCFAQQLSIQTGHSAIIYDLKYSPDGTMLASCSADNKVILWDLLSGKQMNILSGHTAPVNEVSIHPTKKIIASASDDGTVKIWKYPTGELLKTLNFFGNPVKGLAFSPDGKQFACASDFIYIVDTKSFDYKLIGGKNEKGYNSVIFSPDGEKIAFGGRKSKTFVYDRQRQEIIKSYRAKSAELLFTEDNKLLYSAGLNGVVQRMRVDNSLFYRKYKISANYRWDSFYSVILTQKYFAAANRDNLIYIYDRNNGKRVKILKFHTGPVRALAISPDGKFMASAGKDRKIAIWNIKKFQVEKTLEGGAGRVNAISFSKNGKLMFIGYNNGSFRIWNLARKGRILYGTCPEPTLYERLTRNEYSVENTSEFINTKQILIKAALKQRSRRTDEFINTREDMIVWNLGRKAETGLVAGKNNTNFNSYILKDTSKVLSFRYDATHSQKFSLLDARRIKEREQVFSTYIKNTNVNSIYKTNKKKIFKKIWKRKAYNTDGDLYFKTTSGDGNYLITLKKIKNNNTEITILQSTNFEIYSVVRFPHQISAAKLSNTSKYVGLTITDSSKILLYKTEGMEKIAEFNGVFPATFSPNENFFAYADNQRNLHLYDIQNKKEIFSVFTQHQSLISDIKFNTPYSYIATAGHDGLIKFWKIEDGELLLSLAAFGQSEFVYVNPDNYYYATKGAMNYISFLINDKLYSFDQFDIRFNRPDLVLAKLNYSDSAELAAYKRAYKKRIRKMGFSEAQFTGKLNIPKAEIVNREDFGVATDFQTIEIEVTAEDTVVTLDRINIWVNDVPLYGINGYSLQNENIKSITKKFNIPLSTGANKIQVSAVNSKGMESLKETFTLNYNQKNTKPELYLITVGVSNYMNPEYNLNYAAKDAQDIATLFNDHDKNFDKINVISLLNKNATKQHILDVKKQLETTKTDDVVMLFFAGHGVLDDQMNYYLATTEVDLYDLDETALRYDLLEGLLDSIPARKKVVFIDACHSGEVDKDEEFSETGNTTNKNEMLRDIETNEVLRTKNISTQNSFELMKLMFADLRKGTGTTVVSSAGGGEYAYENDKNKNGIFTYIMIKGLATKEADQNKDGQIMISELRDYVMKNVSILTKGHQNPTSRRENLEFDFRIW